MLVTTKDLLSKYIGSADQVLAEIKLDDEMVYIDKEKVVGVVDEARRYLHDAKYYQNRKEFETGLVSVAYSEGLLDALRLLGAAEFQWPRKRGR